MNLSLTTTTSTEVDGRRGTPPNLNPRIPPQNITQHLNTHDLLIAPIRDGAVHVTTSSLPGTNHTNHITPPRLRQ